MPQQKKPDLSGFTPDPEPDLSGFTPDEPIKKMSSGPPPAGEQVSPYKEFFDTISGYIPDSVKKAWTFANTPLTDYPTRAANQLSDAGISMLPAGPIPIPTKLGGEFVTSMLSPLGLTMTALTGGENIAGRAGYDALATGMNLANRAVSAPIAIEGMRNMSNANTWTDTAKGAFQTLLGSLGALHSPASPDVAPEPIELPSPKPRISAEEAAANLKSTGQVLPATRKTTLNMAGGKQIEL